MDNHIEIEVLGSSVSDHTDFLSFITNVEEISAPDSPQLTSESGDSAMGRQLASLQTYLDSLPYKCSSLDEMQAKLEFIVGRIVVCVKSKNWPLLINWDTMLQCWMLMRYPMPTTTRAKLVHLYYELTVLPGVEPRIIRQWADMVSRLIATSPSARRKLEAEDLQLPWQPLWRALKKELWPKTRLHEDSRNVLNVLLYVAEQCKRYFPASEIPNMLSTFLPMLTQDSFLSVIPLLTAFLPPTNTHLYVPPLFKLWEAFNSNVTDERLIELCGELSEENVTGKSSVTADGSEWKDIGIWTEAEWTMLVGKALSSMNVPVGISKGTSTTALHADAMGQKLSLRIKRSTNRYNALAKIFVYSMSVDGPIREETVTTSGSTQAGYIAGSKALDSLDKLITSTESFFHPSNSGAWSIILTNFLQRLAAEFCKRWKEEEQFYCKTPITHRLTPAIRKAFVMSLRTPALLAMFSKDPVSMSLAQSALRAMALLEPGLIMPDVLERAYGGLEAINETHRTTAVLSTLSGVVLPLVSEKRWLGGQKHILPLLELSLPGIDLNDPTKTVCATMFIAAVMQAGVKIGDLSNQAGLSLDVDAPGEEMVIDNGVVGVPEVEPGAFILSKEEERSLARDSTAGFADWTASLFRRVFALFENLPEEGGKRNNVPQQEEHVLRSVKSTLDIVCLHLSDSFFDLVLKLVFDYATTNAKSNAVKAFGQLVSCLARAKPDKTIDKFLPFCINQIQEELKHGASSVRTTSSHAAVPSDTTLHWNLSILRGCLGYGAPSLLKHKNEILGLLKLLIDKTKSERGYSSTGRLLTRITHALSAIYPLNSRFVNTDEWNSADFNQQHYLHWGRLYEARDVKIEWHVPSSEEIAMIFDILDAIGSSILDQIDALLETTGKWDSVARNDFCRLLHAIRSIWGGLPSLLQEPPKDVNLCTYEDIEVDRLLVSTIPVHAGFALSNPDDPLYQKAWKHRKRFGHMLHRAATSVALRSSSEGEDHIDAVLAIAKGMDVFLLEYGMSRTGYDALQKNYNKIRDINRMSLRQKENVRLVFLKRAQLYHASRLYVNSLYRQRSALDDQLIGDIVELSLSSYTRVRRHCQTILQSITGYYVRSTRLCLPTLFNALANGTDPDRMKGALYVLWDKGIAAYSLSDINLRQRYLISLLECQHQEKPSIQKLVLSVTNNCLNQLTTEAVHTNAYFEDTPRVMKALQDLETEFSDALIDRSLLTEALKKTQLRFEAQMRTHAQTVASILEITSRPVTHWRYVEIAARFLCHLIQRNICPSPQLARFFLDHSVSSHPHTRACAVSGVITTLVTLKIRTYSKSPDELWFDEWINPLVRCLPVTSNAMIVQRLVDTSDDVYVDKIRTGFLTWTKDIKAYTKIGDEVSPIAWDSETQATIDALAGGLSDIQFFDNLITLWSQESSRSDTTPELRGDHVQFIKSISKTFEDRFLDRILLGLQPLLTDPDRYKQRAGAEILVGLLRGSKHWPKHKWDTLWEWTLHRMDQIFAQIKPDTLPLWQSVFSFQLEDRDPRRSAPLVQWMLSLPLDFQGESAFTMSKTLALFRVVLENMAPRSSSLSDQTFKLLLDNANTGYNEMRTHIASALSTIISFQWCPVHQSVDAFLKACKETTDPLQIRTARYMEDIVSVVESLPKWKNDRLPPPRTNQSQYDKVGLTLLQWLWSIAYDSSAPLLFRYVIPMLPEILDMSELNDSSELQMYATAVLYVLSAVTPPCEYVEDILNHFVHAIKSSTSWRIRLNALPAVVVFFYRNLLGISNEGATRVMEVLLDCLGDENVEVREMASKALSGIVRCSQRQSIVPLKNRFVRQIRKMQLPSRQDSNYAESLRVMHSTVLGLCALIESFPYSVESWMPPLTDVLSTHASDPPPISTAIRKCASEFKKTHQDTWVKDQLMFDEDQLQNLSTMLVGTSYYA